ncbi:MAG: hypothetical protein AAGB13_16020 [Cyanobacteria bacterium P01_F01_bin.33]
MVWQFRPDEHGCDCAVELSWLAMLRRVPFLEYGFDPGVKAAAETLSRLVDFWGPTILDINSNRVVTSSTLFRGHAPGDLLGPYLSQFLLLAVADNAERSSRWANTPALFPICLEDAITYIRRQSLYQPYLDAATVMQQFPEIWGNAELTDVQARVADAATNAMKMANDCYGYDTRLFAVERVYNLSRPEGDRLKSEAVSMVVQAAIAGAATAELVDLFGADTVIPHPVVPAIDGAALEPYLSQGVGRLGDLTVEGELEKLATNLVITRAIPGLPWRKLFREAFELGRKWRLGL